MLVCARLRGAQVCVGISDQPACGCRLYLLQAIYVSVDMNEVSEIRIADCAGLEDIELGLPPGFAAIA